VHVVRIRDSRSAYSILVEKLLGKVLFDRPRRRWENNVNIILIEIIREGEKWMELAQDCLIVDLDISDDKLFHIFF
jgi:hypothetical protein